MKQFKEQLSIAVINKAVAIQWSNYLRKFNKGIMTVCWIPNPLCINLLCTEQITVELQLSDTPLTSHPIIQIFWGKYKLKASIIRKPSFICTTC